PTTAHGALLGHITGGHVETIDAGPRSFQPMNVNFGLFPPLARVPNKGPDGERLRGTAKTIAKKRALTSRALADLDRWIAGEVLLAAEGCHPCGRKRGPTLRPTWTRTTFRPRLWGAGGARSCSSATCSRLSSAARLSPPAAKSTPWSAASTMCHGGRG